MFPERIDLKDSKPISKTKRAPGPPMDGHFSTSGKGKKGKESAHLSESAHPNLSLH